MGNPDPAVFEAAFALEDSEDPSRSGTPKPTSEKDEKSRSSTANMQEAKEATTPAENGASTPDTGKEKGAEASADDKGTGEDARPTPELPMEVRVKLRKFERLESTYTG